MGEVLNCRGLKCPQPVLKVAIKAATIPAGSTLEVHADCPSFPDDIRKWCEDSDKVLISCVDQGGYHAALVQF